MTKFFHNEATGLNADIKRHKKIQKELEEKILALESLGYLTKSQEHMLRAHRHFLCQLMDSSDQVTSKIGVK